jgi:hypothetical protein
MTARKVIHGEHITLHRPTYSLLVPPVFIYSCPQSTQSGNGHFLAYIPSLWKKSAKPREGVGVHAHLLSQYLPSRTKLWCTLQLRGQVHSIYFYSMYSVADTLPLFLLYPCLYFVLLPNSCNVLSPSYSCNISFQSYSSPFVSH